MNTLQKTQLFWDVDQKSIDPKKNEKFIIERILVFGDMDDVRWAVSTYGRDKLKRHVSKAKTLNKKSLNFWCQYFNIDKNQCMPNLLKKKQSPFWAR